MRGGLPRGSVSCSAVAIALVAGCSFGWEDYRPESSRSSTASGEGAGGGSSTASTGEGGCGALDPSCAEDCTNGADDDGDGDVDCVDPDCSMYTCQDPAPKGWVGPVALFDGSPQDAPSCAQALLSTVYQGFDGLVAEPASCSGCGCSASVTCTLASLAPFADSVCANAKATVPQAPSLCASVMINGAGSYKAAPPTASDIGACAPFGGQPSVPPPNFMSTALACAPATYGGGCGGDQVCAPALAAPFGRAACVLAAGDLVCPAGYGTKLLVHDGVVDTRGCTDCTCTGLPATATCTATTNIYSSPNCNGGVDASIPNDGACHGGADAKSIRVDVSGDAPCPAAGGQPTGTITLGDAVTTICCAG